MEEEILDFLKTASANQIKPFLDSLMSRNFDSYEEFTNFLDVCQPKLSCNVNWLSEQIIASCRNCGMYDNSCICIRCLLDGNHIQENHQIFLQYGESGSCDCGQSASWNPKGFCKNHHGQHGNPEESLPEEMRANLNMIFEALKKFLIPEIENRTFHFFNEIFDFITSISEMGDGVRRLASKSFGETKFIQTILTNCFYFPTKESDTISSFISSYVNDETFSSYFASCVLPYSKVLVERSLESCHVQSNISNLPPLVGPSSILSLVFHVFHEFTLDNKVIDFNDYVKDFFLSASKFIHSNPSLFEGINGRQFLSQIWIVKILLQHYIERKNKEEVKKFFINIASLFTQLEGYSPPFCTINLFNDNSSYYDYTICHNLVFEFSTLSFDLSKKVEYMPEIIEIFVDFLYKTDNLRTPSFLFLLHKLAISTLKNSSDPKSEFDRIIRGHSQYSEIEAKIVRKEENYANYRNVNEYIYFKASQVPLRIVCLIMLRDFDLLPLDEYPNSFLDASDKYRKSYYSQIDLPFLISMIQFMYSFTESKDDFLRMIESHFSIFDTGNQESKEKRMFCFILLISSLICTDPKMIGKKKPIVQLILMTILKQNPNIPTSNLSFYSGPTLLNRAMKWYKQVKFENNWHIVLPFISPNNLLKSLLPQILHKMTISSSGKDKSTDHKQSQNQKDQKSNQRPNNNSILLPFPDFIDSDLIDLRSMMKSTYLYAVMYDIMYDTKEPLLYHYVLNLFILFYKNEQLKSSPSNYDKNQRIIALSVDEISNKISSNFIEFCDIKINYKRGGSYLSLIDLIENSGPLGLNALNRTFHKSNIRKPNIEKVKNRIINKFKRNALNFDYSTVNNLATDVKLKPDQKMFILVDISISNVPDFLESKCHFDFKIKNEDNTENDDKEEEEEDNFDFPFMKKRNRLKRCLIVNTCGHFLNEANVTLKCPKCHSIINFFLPNFNATDDPNLYSDRIYSSLNFFGDLKQCFKMIKNMIIILDFRSRLKPEILQDEMIFLVYKNMYILSMLLIPGIDSSIFTNRKSKLGNFLFDFIFNYNCDSSDFVNNFVTNYVDNLNYQIDYEFLKRIELIRLFFLNKKLELIVDIDEHFSFRNLIDMYKIPLKAIVPTKYELYKFYKYRIGSVDLNEIEKMEIKADIDSEYLPTFRGIDLPENFLQIINDPFNIELVSKKGQENLICLATGEIVNRNYMRNNMPIPSGLNYQPVLIADGPRINATGIWRFNYFTFCSGIYRNKKGDEDIGFANGDPVFLNHERYIDLIDSFISGSCTRRIYNERAEVI